MQTETKRSYGGNGRRREVCDLGHPIEAPNGVRVCRTCRKEYNRQWYRRSQLPLRYGITAEQYDAMLFAQLGLCAVCRREPATDVDHDHETNAIRGLLCHKCNLGIGLFKDSPDALRAAALYLGGQV